MKAKTRNPHAKALAQPIFKKKVIPAKKGKGSYNRRGHLAPSQVAFS